MPKKSPRYDLSTQRHAVEQVLHHHRPIAQVARQLRCSPQSVKNWIDKHHQSPPISSMTFLPFDDDRFDAFEDHGELSGTDEGD